MEITLEKIELVRDRTGVTYKEAKEALEAANGNVVDAIIAIEETIDCSEKNSTKAKKDALISRMKELFEKGNVSRIVVSREDSTFLNIPLNIGIVGTVIAPCCCCARIQMQNRVHQGRWISYRPIRES